MRKSKFSPAPQTLPTLRYTPRKPPNFEEPYPNYLKLRALIKTPCFPCEIKFLSTLFLFTHVFALRMTAEILPRAAVAEWYPDSYRGKRTA